MAWQYDPSPPHVTPEANLDYLCRRGYRARTAVSMRSAISW